ncbi:hypothetical protein Z969_05625 [Clostridium novyi A str. 4570]|uniref:Uncharacterized protein n=1 Tax=Clostridium novyi A str. 4570 TaxID=1444290 RepID=A0AA89CS24_CLONO|nr:hypothetical protein [Clostridium novyi]KGN02402.1 hypothetical protein Z969_05625 [Clostridium novyi A str. 4570]
MTESIELLVVENYNLFGEEVYKCDSEIQAFRKYKELKGCKKNIFRAKVFWQNLMNVPFIMKYEVLEIIV